MKSPSANFWFARALFQQVRAAHKKRSIATDQIARSATHAAVGNATMVQQRYPRGHPLLAPLDVWLAFALKRAGRAFLHPMDERNVRRRVGEPTATEPAAVLPRPESPAVDPFSSALLSQFDEHYSRLTSRAKARRAAVLLKSTVLDKEERAEASELSLLGVRQPQDEFQGDVNLRTLRALLKMIDDRGFERSAHQLKFHSAFERATARVIYRDDWGTQRPAIMEKNGWETCSSEVLISTPRRFGKTFSIGIYAACLALTLKCEVVVFSPARRASRKLLERMVEFVRLLGHEPIEYNQEQCRVKTFDGREALIRSFPVRWRSNRNSLFSLLTNPFVCAVKSRGKSRSMPSNPHTARDTRTYTPGERATTIGTVGMATS